MSRPKSKVPAPSDNCQPVGEEFPYGANVPAETDHEAPPPAPVESDDSPDPWDVESWADVPEDIADLSGTQMPTEVPCRKPAKSWFFRVNPDENYRTAAWFLKVEGKEGRDGETYLIAHHLADKLARSPMYRDLMFRQWIFLAMTSDGDIFLFPVKALTGNEMGDRWSRSLLQAAKEAETKWLGARSNKSKGCYERWEAVEEHDEPKWPATPFKEFVRLAFEHCIIDTLDHPILFKLRAKKVR